MQNKIMKRSRERQIKSTMNLEKLKKKKIRNMTYLRGTPTKKKKDKNEPSVHESSGFMPRFAFTTRT